MESRLELSGVEMREFETEIPATFYYELDGKDVIVHWVKMLGVAHAVNGAKGIAEIEEAIISDLKEQGEQARLEMKLELIP